MREQTFYGWLKRELISSRMALVSLYEQKDKLLFVEAPPLRQQYMDKIGVVEMDVLEAELDVLMLERKAELIQTAINRNEPIDLDKIEHQLAEERKQKIAETEAADLTLHDFKQLSEQDLHTMQRLYRDIINQFQPSMNPDISDTEKELYEKALQAYQAQDLDAMKVLHSALFDGWDEITLTLNDKEGSVSPEEEQQARRDDYREITSALATDYTLAKKLYRCFRPLEEDTVVIDTLSDYQRLRKVLEKEIQEIRTGFPFNAASVLTDVARTGEYLEDLKLRAKDAAEKKKKMETKIMKLLEGQIHG